MTAVLPVRRAHGSTAAARGGRAGAGLSGLARVIVVIGFSVALCVAATVSATATFSEKVTAAPVQVATTTLPAVDGLEVKYVVCDLSTVSAQVEWLRSATPQVSGYRVTARMADGQTELIAAVGPNTLEVPFTRDRTWLQRRPTFTVTMVTSYGWTSVTAPSGVLTC